MTDIRQELLTFGPPIALALGGLVLGLVLQRVVLARIALVARQTRTGMDDAALAAFRGPLVLWCTMLGLYAGVETADFPPRVAVVSERALLIVLILSVTWVIARLAGNLIRPHSTVTARLLPSTRLVTNLIRGAVLALGALILLDTIGISVTPFITALGVGGIAIGLALQDTLSNLFAGIHILVSRQLRPGDFVQLASGQKGYIKDVTWRYTTIQELSNNVTIVPNSALASAVTANFNLPNTELGIAVDVAVAYNSDLRHVEQVTVEVAQEVMREVDGAVKEFVPFIRYDSFGDTGIHLSVNLQVKSYVAQYLVRHEFIKRLHERYRTEGIAFRAAKLRPPQPVPAPSGS